MPTHTDDLLDRLAKASAEVRKQGELADGFVGYRDRLIRDAIKRGVGVGVLVKETGLSRRRIYQIRDEA